MDLSESMIYSIWDANMIVTRSRFYRLMNFEFICQTFYNKVLSTLETISPPLGVTNCESTKCSVTFIPFLTLFYCEHSAAALGMYIMQVCIILDFPSKPGLNPLHFYSLLLSDLSNQDVAHPCL